MMRSMHHRGPDDAGTFHNSVEASPNAALPDRSGASPNAVVALGQNRLSIIDLSRDGHQPMINDANGDVLVFNGEIYNFIELRAELKSKGHLFRSKSDTEVLLYAFAEWGIACLSRLEGMYAFALWRPSENAMYLVRDPLGIKPLYYWPQTLPESGGVAIAFASELKALLGLPNFKPMLDRRAIGQFLEFGYTFDAERTCIEGVKKLPPGHYMRIEASNVRAEPRQYYRPDLKPNAAQSDADAETELYETLSLVVRQHLIADVPVGLLLSGGLDSSILAAMAAKTTRIKTISMGFAESSLDERSHAKIVADHVGSDHEEVLITPGEIKDGLSETIYFMDDLFADWGTISTRLLYAKCRERGVKVVIVGEGSDELFGGYDVFRRGEQRGATDWWLFQLYRYYSGQRHGRHFAAFREIMRQHLRDCDGDRFGAIRLFETRQQLPNNYVMKVDKASMSVSVEARVPFLDRRVAAIAYRTPASRSIAPGTEKILLRRMAERFNLLPEHTLNRRKLGGSIAASWMDDQPAWRAYAKEIILDRGSWTHELGYNDAMRAYFVDHRPGYAFPHAISIFRNLAWRLLILELWAKAYKVSPNVA